jgi:hypothetical protein
MPYRRMMYIVCIMAFLLPYYGADLSAGSCVDNPIIKKLELVQPVANSLVPAVYYTKMAAELITNLEAFKAIQHELHICVNASVGTDSGVRTIFAECGRSVFGQGVVTGEPGTNYLHVALHHKSIQLCEADVVIRCCVDDKAAAEFAAKQLRERMTTFTKLGAEMMAQVQPLLPAEATGDSAPMRYQSSLSYWLEGAQTQDIVLVGIKSSALNLVKRNSIRATWMRHSEENDPSADTIVHILPFFIIGDSALVSENETVAEIIMTEHRFYRDTLLQHEIPVADSYLTLGEKVLAFANWTRQLSSSGQRQADYVVICDDDVFIDVWQLRNHIRGLQKRQQYYAGEVKPNAHPCSATDVLPMRVKFNRSTAVAVAE